MTALSILFVDDEPRILEGIRRMLRGMGGEWEMRFVEGGAAALAELARAPSDVVVSDMRMPGMSGADLLEQIKERWPETVRIVLSGQADQELATRTVRCAHQFLGKPCAPDVLRATILRSYGVRALVSDPGLRRLAGGVDALPSLPAIYEELMAVVRDPNAAIADAAAVVARDPAMSAKLLQVVNSAFFGLRRQVSRPGDAASLLGFEALRALVLTAHAFRTLPASELADERWRNAMAVAAATRAIARAEAVPPAIAEQAVMAGMLHDVGQILLEARMPEQYPHLVRQVRLRGIRIEAAEEALLGSSHGPFGAYLLGLWGLADEIVEAVAHHHAPARAPVPAFGALALVHAAEALVGDGEVELDAAYLAQIGKDGRIDAWRAAIAERAAPS
jgi:HD-like signal output (HDOD) protein/ActR/RegA family two-component response regulator